MRIRALAITFLVTVAFVSIPVMPAVSAATFVVNSTGDGGDVNVADGVCDDGTVVPEPPLRTTPDCTLRAAIEEANAWAGADTIAFDIRGDGVQRMGPLWPLPDITDSVVIDGGTQANDVVLTGTSAGPNADGLRFLTTGSTVRDLIIEEFSGAGIHFIGGGSNSVEGSRLGYPTPGLRTSSAQGLIGNADGLLIEDSSGNIVGGSDASARNVITGNGTGIRIIGPASTGNLVQGNYIGTDPAGIPASSNGAGIVIFDGDGNLIARNVISGNSREGIGLYSNSNGNFVEGNHIGTNAAGDAAIPNDIGIYVEQSTHNIIGGFGAAGNLISGNRMVGIRLWEGSETEILGNYIGVDAAGTTAIPNGYGIFSEYGWANTIGGTDPRARNVISGNGIGIEINDSTGISRVNTVQGNYIGTDATGTASLFTQQQGIIINGSSGNLIGGTDPGARNVISGNNGAGIQICCLYTTGNVIQGNYIGSDATGTKALYNGTGIYLQSAGENLIGGSSAARNIISGNGTGVSIEYGATHNTLKGNYIGTDVTGQEPLANFTGVLITNADDNTVGGVLPEEANIIAFSEYAGVWVYGFSNGAEANTIRGNSIHSNGYEGIRNEYGGNLELPPPVLTGKTSVSGTACPDCTVDVYSDNEDEGRVYHGSTVADANGNWSFAGDVGGPNLTATATDGGGSTSEFSAPVKPPFCTEFDRDCDRVFDADESACESDPLNASSRPERLDGPFAGVDDDGDGLIDEPLPWEQSYSSDCDGDGYRGEAEDHIGTSSQDACGLDGWPSDLVGGSLRPNTLNLEDLGSFVVPVRRLGTTAADPAFDPRWDLDHPHGANLTINLGDMAALVTGKSGYPAMFGGQRAFGTTCPWAP